MRELDKFLEIREALGYSIPQWFKVLGYKNIESYRSAISQMRTGKRKLRPEFRFMVKLYQFYKKEDKKRNK